MKTKYILPLFLLAALTSCTVMDNTPTPGTNNKDDNKQEEDKTPQFELTKSRLYLGVGESDSISYECKNCSVSDMDFSSLDTSVVTVSNNGRIKAVKEGQTEVIVKVDGIDEDFSVYVYVYNDLEVTGYWYYQDTEKNYTATLEFTKDAPANPFYSSGTSYKLNIWKDFEGVTDTYLLEYWTTRDDDGTIGNVNTMCNEEDCTVLSSDKDEILRQNDDNVSYLTIVTAFDDIDTKAGTMTFYLGTQMSFYEETDDGKIIDWTSVIGSYYRIPEGEWGFSHPVGVSFSRKKSW